MRGALLVLATVALGGLLLWLNVQPFLKAREEMRVKDISFLPDPELVRLLAMGHPNTLSRLRWIDSFAYLQLQFDKKDDALVDGESGFARLYEGLVALDPLFLPYYQHAATALGGVLNRHELALGFLMRGIQEMPDQQGLWMHAAAVLHTDFHWEEQQTDNFQTFLQGWADAMATDNAKAAVWQWQSAMSRRHFRGLSRLGYWLDQVAATAPGSPLAVFVERIAREQIARYGENLLNDIADERRTAGLPVERIEDLLDPERLTAHSADATWGPVTVTDGHLALRSDPYGHPYRLVDGKAVSAGLFHYTYERRIDGWNFKLRSAATEAGRWPVDLAEVRAMDLEVPEPPPGVSLRYEDRTLICTLDDPPGPPWPLR